MTKKLKDRIFDSFEDNDRDSAKQYLEWLNSKISDVCAQGRRSATLLIFVIVAFEFLIGSPRSRFNLAGFSVTRDSVVLQFIPALAAYLILQVIVDTERLGNLRDAFVHTFARWSPAGEENDLDAVIRPVDPLYWNVAWGARAENRRAIDQTGHRISTILQAVIALGILAFEAQAYYLLFPSSAISRYILWALSLSTTLFCLASTFIYMSSFEGDLSSPPVLSDGCRDSIKIIFGAVQIHLVITIRPSKAASEPSRYGPLAPECEVWASLLLPISS